MKAFLCQFSPTARIRLRFESDRTAVVEAVDTHIEVLSYHLGQHSSPAFSFSLAWCLVFIVRQSDSSDSTASIYNNQCLYLGPFLITVSALEIKPSRSSCHVLPYPGLPWSQLLPDMWFHLKFSTSGRFSWLVSQSSMDEMEEFARPSAPVRPRP